MQKKRLFIKTILAIIIMLTTICSTITYAHSGRTDKNGGHKDNKNASGLGNYHYHCGGHEAHLHPNGVCQYTGSGKNTSSTNTSSKSNTTTKKNTSTQAKSTKQNNTQETSKAKQQNTVQEKNKTTNQTNNKTTNQKLNQTQNSNQKETQTQPQTQASIETQPKIPTEIPVETVKIINESDKTELKIGETIKLKATISPDNSTNKTITWISSNEKVATVDSSGTVKAVSDGEVTIIAKSNNSKQDTLNLVVKRNPVLVEKIVINNSISKINVGEELALEVSVVPENADNKGFVISSSNEDIIKVVDNKIKAVSSGDAVITVCSDDKNATCSFDVSVVGVRVEENFNEKPVENRSSLNSNSGNSGDNQNNGGVATVAMASVYGGIAYVIYKKYQ